MPDPKYTITRYEFPLLKGTAAHGYYVLERINADGNRTPITALHGMATDRDNEPKDIGLPWEDHTIKAHQYQNPYEVQEAQNGIIRSDRVPTKSDIDHFPYWEGSIRRGDLGEMSREEAVAKYNIMMNGAAAMNDKNAPYSIFNTNSNTVNKHLGELIGDLSIGNMAWDGTSLGHGGEGTKPGFGQRLLTPEEIRSINPYALIVHYQTPDPLGMTRKPRSTISLPNGNSIETDEYGQSKFVRAPVTKNTLPAPNDPQTLDQSTTQPQTLLGQAPMSLQPPYEPKMDEEQAQIESQDLAARMTGDAMDAANQE